VPEKFSIPLEVSSAPRVSKKTLQISQIETPPIIRERGRPRLNPNRPLTDAERAAKYRKKRHFRDGAPIRGGGKPAPIPPQTANCTSCTEIKPCSNCLYQWNRYLAHSKLPVAKADNFFLAGAPQGCGRLVTGGYDSNKIESVEGAKIRAKTGNVPIRGGAYDKKSADAKDKAEEFRNNFVPYPGSTWKQMKMTAEQIRDVLRPLYENGGLDLEYRQLYERWYKGLQ
jgi:hypothetical protein